MHGNLWHDTAQEPPLEAPPFEGDATTSCAIVGGGFTGVSAALHLAQAGVDCVLLEAGAIGEGASGRNNGQVIPGLKIGPSELMRRYGDAGAAVVETAATAANLVFELIEDYAIRCEGERRGWVRAAHDRRAMPAVEALAADWQGHGAPVDVLDGRQSEGLLGTSGYVGGLIDRRAGRLQPLAYARGLARAARAAGARLHEGTRAERLERHGPRWRLALSGGRTLSAETVVLATGAYDETLIPGWSRSYLTVYAGQVASAPLSSNVRQTVLAGTSAMSDTRKLATAMRLDGDGRIVISGRAPLSGRLDATMTSQLARAVGRLYPQVGELTYTHLWSGRIAITLNSLPRLASPSPGVYAVAGFNGRGVAMATAFGKAVAHHVCGRPAGFPVEPAARVPFYGLRKPALGAAIAYYRMRDALGLDGR